MKDRRQKREVAIDLGHVGFRIASSEPLIDVSGIEIAFAESRCFEDLRKKRNVRPYSFEVILAESALHAGNRVVASSAPGDEFRNHRIVIDRHGHSFMHTTDVTGPRS